MLLHNQSKNVSFFTASYILEKLQPPPNPPLENTETFYGLCPITAYMRSFSMKHTVVSLKLWWLTLILRIFLKAQHVSQYTATNITNHTASIFIGCCFKHPFISGTFLHPTTDVCEQQIYLLRLELPNSSAGTTAT